MAENETNPEDVEAPAPTAKLGWQQLLIIVGIILVTEAGMLFAWEALRPTPMTPEEAAAAAAAEAAAEDEEPEVNVADLEPAIYIAMPPAFLVNIQGGGSSRYLQADIQLMTRDQDVNEAIVQHRPAIRQELLLLLAEADVSNLGSREGKEALSEKARAAADAVLLEFAGVEGVEELHFTSFVIQ